MIVRPKNISTLPEQTTFTGEQKNAQDGGRDSFEDLQKGGSQQFPHYALWWGSLEEAIVKG